VRKAFKYWQSGPVSLLDLAVPLLLSMALVRAAIYVCATPFLRAVGWRLPSASSPPASGSAWRSTSPALRHR
jgi:hypothetical protein